MAVERKKDVDKNNILKTVIIHIANKNTRRSKQDFSSDQKYLYKR
jgi:hypothetical protein